LVCFIFSIIIILFRVILLLWSVDSANEFVSVSLSWPHISSDWTPCQFTIQLNLLVLPFLFKGIIEIFSITLSVWRFISSLALFSDLLSDLVALWQVLLTSTSLSSYERSPVAFTARGKALGCFSSGYLMTVRISLQKHSYYRRTLGNPISPAP
jgi:hypothetical protein